MTHQPAPLDDASRAFLAKQSEPVGDEIRGYVVSIDDSEGYIRIGEPGEVSTGQYAFQRSNIGAEVFGQLEVGTRVIFRINRGNCPLEMRINPNEPFILDGSRPEATEADIARDVAIMTPVTPVLNGVIIQVNQHGTGYVMEDETDANKDENRVRAFSREMIGVDAFNRAAQAQPNARVTYRLNNTNMCCELNLV